mmetsp:Transcript_1620/g.2970  ORF Transcript_1620/g.2970 Transcript_1620/m.2970 type:complete len:383 (+) Transcript_1620:55-1203(+)
MGYIFVPESPLWLLKVGRGREAQDVLRACAAKNGVGPEDVVDIDLLQPGRATPDTTAVVSGQTATGSPPAKSAPVPSNFQEGFEAYKSKLFELFLPSTRPTVMLLIGLWASFGFSYYGLILSTTRVFRSDSFGYAEILTSCSAEVFGILLCLHVVDNPDYGRVWSATVFYLLAAPFAFILCNSLMPIFGFLARLFLFAAISLTWVSTPEILPTEVRGTGHAVANAAARLGAFCCPYVVHNMKIPLSTVGVTLMASCTLAAMFTSKLEDTTGANLDGSPSTGMWRGAGGFMNVSFRGDRATDTTVSSITASTASDKRGKRPSGKLPSAISTVSEVGEHAYAAMREAGPVGEKKGKNGKDSPEFVKVGEDDVLGYQPPTPGKVV